MDKKPDFTKIDQTVFAASTAYILGYFMKLADTLQGYLLLYGISIPYPILFVGTATILFLILLKVVEFLWDFLWKEWEDKRKKSIWRVTQTVR